MVLKNAKGHAYHELAEPLMEQPVYVSFVPVMSMASRERAAFEEFGSGLDLWPEVGSRMTSRLVAGVGMAGGFRSKTAGTVMPWTGRPAVPSVRSSGSIWRPKRTGNVDGVYGAGCRSCTKQARQSPAGGGAPS